MSCRTNKPLNDGRRTPVGSSNNILQLNLTDIRHMPRVLQQHGPQGPGHYPYTCWQPRLLQQHGPQGPGHYPYTCWQPRLLQQHGPQGPGHYPYTCWQPRLLQQHGPGHYPYTCWQPRVLQQHGPQGPRHYPYTCWQLHNKFPWPPQLTINSRVSVGSHRSQAPCNEAGKRVGRSMMSSLSLPLTSSETGPRANWQDKMEIPLWH